MRRLLSPRWIFLHVLAVVLVVVFLRLGWWQLDRGEAGNALSWGYTIEWPAFAACVLFMWYKMAHLELHPEEKAGAPVDEPGAGASAAPRSEGDAAPRDGIPPDGEPVAAPPRRAPFRQVPAYVPEDEQDEELAAYNAYLARLNAPRSR